MAQTLVSATVDGNCIHHKLKPRFPKVRRKIQHFFVAWLNEHQGDFKHHLQFVSREDGYLLMGMPKLNPALNIYLNQGGMGVSVHWQGFCWDLLVCFDTAPMPTADGYYCDFCMPEYRTYYASREALWQAELFEPFLDWLNNKLFPATWLGLYRVKGGGIWAELLHEPDPKTHVLLPVWLPKERETNNDG
jgi:hypothetical protein